VVIIIDREISKKNKISKTLVTDQKSKLRLPLSITQNPSFIEQLVSFVVHMDADRLDAEPTTTNPMWTAEPCSKYKRSTVRMRSALNHVGPNPSDGRYRRSAYLYRILCVRKVKYELTKIWVYMIISTALNQLTWHDAINVRTCRPNRRLLIHSFSCALCAATSVRKGQHSVIGQVS
jgi:hypothetical protein